MVAPSSPSEPLHAAVPAEDTRLGDALERRAMSGSNLPFTIVDARAPDMPLVWVNSAFTESTGYSADEVLGTNCRFLQGPETDRIIAALPSTRPRRDGELAVVRSTVRAAAVDRRGNLWVSFTDPFTYVFDAQGDKIRTVQFRGVDVISPTGLFFTTGDRLLITPGLFEFDPR